MILRMIIVAVVVVLVVISGGIVRLVQHSLPRRVFDLVLAGIGF